MQLELSLLAEPIGVPAEPVELSITPPRAPEPAPADEQPPALPLVEASLAEAIQLIEASHPLSTATRSQWVCSLRQVSRALDRPPETIPARWTALRLPVSRLHHGVLGITPKSPSGKFGFLISGLVRSA